MDYTHPREGPLGWKGPALAAALLAVWAAGAGTTAGQASGADPVDRLRRALQAPSPDLPGRERAVRECLGALQSLPDLHRALTLPEWRDRHHDAALAASDQAAREALV